MAGCPRAVSSFCNHRVPGALLAWQTHSTNTPRAPPARRGGAREGERPPVRGGRSPGGGGASVVKERERSPLPRGALELPERLVEVIRMESPFCPGLSRRGGAWPCLGPPPETGGAPQNLRTPPRAWGRLSESSGAVQSLSVSHGAFRGAAEACRGPSKPLAAPGAFRRDTECSRAPQNPEAFCRALWRFLEAFSRSSNLLRRRRTFGVPP